MQPLAQAAKLTSVALISIVLAACGGGKDRPTTTPSPAGGGPPAASPPVSSTLNYPVTSLNAVLDQALSPLSPTITGKTSNFTIAPALPPGLAIDGATGVISGAPTAAMGAVTYTISAQGGNGALTTTITIAVTDVALQQIQGAGTETAIYTLPIATVGYADPANIDGTLIRTRLLAVIAAEATVEQVNAALRSIGGGVGTSFQGSPLISIVVPPVANEAAALEFAARLQQTGAFSDVTPSYAVSPINAIPREARVPLPSQFAHLQLSRAPAAWNLRELLSSGTQRTPLIVADVFNRSQINATAAADISIDFGDSLRTETHVLGAHGWHVAAIAASDFDGLPDTGVHPAATQRMPVLGVPVSLSGEWEVSLITLYRAMRGLPDNAKFVLNTSLGYNDPPPYQHFSPALRANMAVLWQQIGSLFENRFIHATAAGNSGEDSNAEVAARGSPFSSAASFVDPCVSFGLIGPSLLSCQRGAIGRRLTNIIIVGAADPSGSARASFSDKPFHIAAQGEGLDLLCVPTSCTPGPDKAGTSYAAPQIAGLAGMLWNLSPNLTVEQLRKIIVQSYRTDLSPKVIRQVDTYAAVLALDNTLSAASIRHNLLNVVGSDLVFNDADLTAYWTAFNEADGAEDYSRYDLNGDGFTGGNTMAPFNLDASAFGQSSSLYTLVSQVIDGRVVEFDENRLTDFEVLCYYAYSSLWQGTNAARQALGCSVEALSFKAGSNRFFTAKHVDAKGQVGGSVCTEITQNGSTTCTNARAVSYTNGAFTDLSARVSTPTLHEVLSASDAGHILARHYTELGGVRDYLLTAIEGSQPTGYTATLLSFAPGGADFFTTTAVNDQGMVGGTVCTEVTQDQITTCVNARAVIYANGTFTNVAGRVQGPALTLHALIAMGDAGHVLARHFTDQGGIRDYLLTPVTPPASGEIPQFTAQLLSFLGGAGTFFTASSVGADGIVGGSRCTEGPSFCSSPRAMLYQNGALVPFTVPGFVFTDVLSIGDSGFVLVRDGESAQPGVRDYLVSPLLN